jgi:DeoR family fructose operon transcriptional repressor
MPAESRRLQIMDIINRTGNGVVSVTELAQVLEVSEMTVRRDLDWLEQRTLLTRVHGGAVAIQFDLEKPFGDRVQEYNPQKKSIGWAAAQLVQNGDRIILDAGTTTQQIAQHLSGISDLTVITNNIPLSTDLARLPQIKTILLGGELKHQELCTVGAMVKQGLSILAVDKLFLSAAGFSIRNGVTDQDMREVEVKQAMMQAANEVILVADSSKYNKAHLVKICELAAVKMILTDDALPVEALAALETEGMEVITPERVGRRPMRP